MGIRLYIANMLVSMMPPTRLYKAKAILLRAAGVNIHPSVRVVSSAKIWGGGNIRIGAGSFLGHETLLLGGENATISIEANVAIGPRVVLVTGKHMLTPDESSVAGPGFSESIVIEEGAWVGSCAIVLGGTRIGKKSVIGAGSVVTKSIPAHTIAVGNPCRVVKQTSDIRLTAAPSSIGPSEQNSTDHSRN